MPSRGKKPYSALGLLKLDAITDAPLDDQRIMRVDLCAGHPLMFPVSVVSADLLNERAIPLQTAVPIRIGLPLKGEIISTAGIETI